MTSTRLIISLTVNSSPLKNMADRVAPNTGMNNLYILSSPALLNFKSMYQSKKAVADINAAYRSNIKLVPSNASPPTFNPTFPTIKRIRT